MNANLSQELFGAVAAGGVIQSIARAGAAAVDGSSGDYAVDASTSVSKLMRNHSLVSVSNVGRVEPLTLVDSDCAYWDHISDVMQSVHAMFSGYYLQAVALTNHIGKISVVERLAPLNPTHTGFEEHKDGSQDRTFRLQRRKPNYASPVYSFSYSAEQYAARKIANEDVSLSSATKDYENITQAANLSVGKLFNIKLSAGAGNNAEIPVAVRLMVNVLPSSLLSELFTYRDSFDMNLKERWYAMRAGRLSFLYDFVLCLDLLAKSRRMAIKDKSGIGKMILDREAGQVTRALAGKDSYSTASNIAIISETTMAMIQTQIGPFSNTKVRTSVFENTNLMLLVVVDRPYERVTIYTRDLDSYTTLSIKDMKAASKGGGADVSEIMKAYMAGSSIRNF
jgi:hypothetical protein